MWASLSSPWKISFEQGWIAFCSGSIPIGAAVVDAEGAILSQGRSMQHDTISTENFQIMNHPLSHAEVNALLGLDYDQIDPHTCVLYTIVEPCPLCVGAIAMARFKRVEYAARDPYAGCTDMISSHNYLIQKQIQVHGPQNQDLEDVITALQTVFLLGTNRPSADRVLNAWHKVLERGVSLGQRIHEAGDLYRLTKDDVTAKDALGYLYSELRNI